MEPDYIQSAIDNPKNFTIEVVTMDSLDWEYSRSYTRRVYVHPLNPKDHTDYTTVDNPEDCADLIDTFESQNPKGINDKRN